MNEKICAITGANGYVGSVVARWFANRGWKVFALTRGETAGPYPQIPFSLIPRWSRKSLRRTESPR